MTAEKLIKYTLKRLQVINYLYWFVIGLLNIKQQIEIYLFWKSSLSGPVPLDDESDEAPKTSENDPESSL